MLKKVLQTIERVKDKKKPYSGKGYDVGYHTLDLRGEVFKGQRDNLKRLSR